MQSDQELILQFQKSIQREQTFTQLVKKHQAKVYHQIKRMVNDHDLEMGRNRAKVVVPNCTHFIFTFLSQNTGNY
jgi:hypothetical protein